ncbi:MAG: Rieske (2Fe-2S) protein [Acidimicrobiales bacterium]
MTSQPQVQAEAQSAAQGQGRSGNATRVKIGTLDELQKAGQLTGKVGSRPVCVFWDDGCAYAVEDRCPHMGFPLHRGTVQSGLLTCHWHHARFDLVSGGTLDPFADDVPAYEVDLSGGDVCVVVEPQGAEVERLQRRLEEGLEQGISLVIAKAVIGLLSAGVDVRQIVDVGVRFGVKYRGPGWGTGLTVLVAMSNICPFLDPTDRALALVHGLVAVSDDTVGRPARFALEPLSSAPDIERLSSWYRRFIDTRSSDAAERSLATAIAAGNAQPDVATMMLAAVTDHVFIDEGHVLDFTNKAFEFLEDLGWDTAAEVLTTLVGQTSRAQRHEEESSWRHPDDLTVLLRDSTADLATRLSVAATSAEQTDGFSNEDLDALAWALLSESPHDVVGSIDGALDAGATPEQLARAVAYAAALRIVRFHTQNDHGDWNVVHHAFTAANALHQSMVRAPSPELMRGVYQCALRVYLDRFLNVPAARLPSTFDGPADLTALASCWDSEGKVDEAGGIVFRLLTTGGPEHPADPRPVISALGRQLLTEDAGFHWYQILEASIRHFAAWPPGSDQGALIMAGTARFLAAHTPTRRELSHVVHIATRLRRGEPLYEETDVSAGAVDE